jgi:hypothetical protein
MNDRYTHTGNKPLEDAIDTLPSVRGIELPKKDESTDQKPKPAG